MNPNGKWAFQGSGWAFPLHTSGGQTATKGYEEQIKQSIRLILDTDPGERRMRPDFGAGLNSFLFEPVSSATLQRIRQRVHDSLVDWEPRIDVDKVAVTVDDSEPGRLSIDVSYRVRTTNSRANLVYPFYLDEGSRP